MIPDDRAKMDLRKLTCHFMPVKLFSEYLFNTIGVFIAICENFLH